MTLAAVLTQVVDTPDVPGYVRFFDVNVVLLAVCALLACWFVAGTHRRRPWDAVMLAPGIVLTAYINWDLLAVALLAGALWAWARDKPLLAGVLIGLGTAAKLYPILLLGPLLVLCLRGGQQAQADGHCQPHNQQDADKQVTQHQRRGRSGSAKVGLINQGCSHGLGLLLNGERLNGCGLRAGMALPPTEKAVTQKNQKFRALAKQRPAASDATSHLRKRHSGVLRRRGQAKALGQQRGNGVIKPH